MIKRIAAMLYKEFIQIRRDTTMLRLLILLPIVQLTIFGFAIDTDVKHMPTAVLDECNQEESRELLNVLTATGYYDIKYRVSNFEELNSRIASGDAVAGIVFPADMVRDTKRGRPAQIQLIVDGSDTSSANSAISTAQLAVQKASQAQLQVQQSGGYDLRIRPWYNFDFVSVYNIVPGIIGIVLTMTLVLVAGISIVREREEGTLEQLMVTPLQPIELMIGKIVPYIFIGYVQITIAIILGRLIFGVPFEGSLILFYALSTLFMLATLSLGIFISTIAQNQMQAMQMSFFILLPSILLSGFVFPRLSMPKIFYWLSAALPMTHYIEIARGIFLKGLTMEYMYTQAIFLLCFSVCSLSLSIWRFRRSL